MAKTSDPRFFIKLRSQIMRYYPALANLIFKVEYEFTNQLPTAATDGYTVLFRPEFMDMISEKAQYAVLGHELMHAALLHAQSMKRLPEHKIKKGNIAADFLVNSFIKELGLLDEQVQKELVDVCGVLFLNDKYNCVDYSWEKLMHELPDDLNQCQKLGKQSGKAPKVPQDNYLDIILAGGEKSEGMSQADIDRANEMKQAFVQAVNQHKKQMKQQGKGAGFLDRFLDNLLANKINWKHELFDFFRRTVKDEISFKRPNRRFLPTGFYYPIRSGVGAGRLGVAIDLSGSIGQEEINIFMSEMHYIFEICHPEKIILVGFDDGVRSVEELDEFPTSYKFKGGGGTNFCPVFTEFEKHDIEALVFFTDMYGPFPKQAPDYPTLFISTSDVKDAPFGRVINYEKKL